MNRDILEKTVGSNLDQLPSLPEVVNKVLSLMEKEDTTTDMVAHAISRDQAMAAKLLKLINSPFYGFSDSTLNIQRATVLLGLVNIRNMLLALSIYTTVSKGRFDTTLLPKPQFLAHTLSCAVGARLLAQKTGYKDPEKAFVAALFHDIGKTVLVSFFHDNLADVIHRARSSPIELTLLEQEIIGVTHEEAGMWLLEKWNIPDIKEAILHHHHPQQIPDKMKEDKDLAYIIFIADTLSKILGMGLGDGDYIAPDFKEALTRFDINPDDYYAIFEQIVDEMHIVKSDFSIDFHMEEISSKESDILNLAEQLFV